MKTNQEYKNAALDRIRGNWTPILVASIIYVVIEVLIIGGCSLPEILNSASGTQMAFSGVNTVLSIFILGPLGIGAMNAFKNLYLYRDLNVAPNMLNFSISNYLHKVLGYFFMELKVFLWSLLLIVPGVVMALAYAMTPYILEEHPEISAWEASTKSREMMQGHKFDLLYLYLSFLGWAVLSLLTCGIGFIWLTPYFQTTIAAFYEDIKGPEATTVDYGA